MLKLFYLKYYLLSYYYCYTNNINGLQEMLKQLKHKLKTKEQGNGSR